MTHDANTPDVSVKTLEANALAAADNFVLRNIKAIVFLTAALCLAGAYSGFTMPAAVFPQTDFPRVVILIDNGVMPADEMMATITRPVEEAMKYIPGTTTIRSTTSRGSAAVNVFFDWSADMERSELYVLGRLAEIRSKLPPHAEFAVHRLTFSAFPILGVSLTSATRSQTELWEKARYDLYPRFLRLKGVARVNLVGGRVPEYHVVVDPVKLEAHRLTLDQVTQALAATNLFVSAGMHEENHQLYLSVVDNRLRRPDEIPDLVVAWSGQSPIRVRDLAAVKPGAAPVYRIVTADGKESVLLNVYSQPDGNTVGIADALQDELQKIRRELPPDMKLAFFYDQSLFVREGVASVWESIILGFALSVVVLYVFLRSASATMVAALVIPVTVLITLVGLRWFGMSFNLMTLGGIAAVVGIVIDDAIVVVEAIYFNIQAGHAPRVASVMGLREVGPALVGSTLTPVVVFIPLAFLEGVPGVFFRALALTMVVALLTSLLLAVTWTPATGGLLIRRRTGLSQQELEQGGPVLRRIVALYEWAMRLALRHTWASLLVMLAVGVGGGWVFSQLQSDFLPAQDEGGFVLDYFSRPGTSLTETNRMLRHVEEILVNTPDVESYSRRTGARLALALAEPNFGDFLVKLKPQRTRTTTEVIDDLRAKINAAEPALHTTFAGILGDLITDLTYSPSPIEIKLFSTDVAQLKQAAAEVAKAIESVPGVVDINDGLIVAGPTMRFRVRTDIAARAGLLPRDVGTQLQTALLGNSSSYVLQGDRTYGVRVVAAPEAFSQELKIEATPLRSLRAGTPAGLPAVVTIGDVTDVEHEPGILEMRREDLRQLVAVNARLSGVDLGHAIQAIQHKIESSVKLPAGMTIEYSGLYEQQRDSFRNLSFVLAMATVLVFGVLIIEFRSVLAPLAILAGSILALSGVVVALWLTGTSLNIVALLGTIIGVGIVAKNGILMLDFVDTLRSRGLTLFDALVQSGRRRLRPVLMTSLTTFLGLLPLAHGVGAGADMLKPLAIAVIGALCMSLLLSLIATPLFYYVLIRLLRLDRPAPHTKGITP